MFNKLKYPARDDLPVRGIKFVEGTGASYPAQGSDGAGLKQEAVKLREGWEFNLKPEQQ